MMKKPYSIVVTGPDASGKDTQTERLREEFDSRGLRTRVISVWDCFCLFQGRAEPAALQTILQTFLVEFDPLPRSLFLQSILSQAVHLLKSPTDTDVIIYNGYAPKYWASEMVYGAPSKIWENAVSSLLPYPDLVFVLDCPASACEARRVQWSPYESGEAKSSFSKRLTRSEFQTQLRDQLSVVVDRCAMIWQPKHGLHHINATVGADSVFAQIRSHLRDIHATSQEMML